jgi:hypothetical protein
MTATVLSMPLTAEESLLLITARAYLRESDDATIRKLVAGTLNWPHVLWRSESYRTITLLHYHLKRLGLLEGLPEEVRGYLDCWSTMSETRSRALYRELATVLDALESEGIDYFLLKGSALSPLIYPEPLLRPMLDMDLMVHQQDIRRARRAMFALGYQHGIWNPLTNRIRRLKHTLHPGYFDEHHELPAFLKTTPPSKSPVPPALIPASWKRKHIKCHVAGDGTVSFPVFMDLHINLSVGFEAADVWRGATREVLLGRVVRVQSITGMLWFIAARLYHEAFQYSTLKLVMLGDVHAILERRGKDVDWAEVLVLAHKYGMQPALYYVFSLLANTTGAAIPEKVIASLAPDPTDLPRVHDWGDVLPKLLSRPVVHQPALA